jgi:hypothetical protein
MVDVVIGQGLFTTMIGLLWLVWTEWWRYYSDMTPIVDTRAVVAVEHETDQRRKAGYGCLRQQ